MTEIKPYTLAGRYYPDNKEDLEKLIKELFMEAPKDYNTTTRILMVPHAAYKYSGKIMASAYQYLDKNLKTVFVFSPAHYLLFYGLALASYEKWSTPLGEVSVNPEISKEVMEKFDADYNDRAFEEEHAIEVQLPFIQTVLPNVQIVPMLFGNSNFSRIQHIVDNYWYEDDIGFIFSSDMTHFYSEAEASRLDEANAELLEQRMPADYMVTRSTLSNGLIATSEFAREKGYSIIRIALTTSGEIAGSDAKVEGYGSWMLVEEGRQEFIKREFSDIVLTICRNSIISGLEYGTPVNTDGLELAPVFVTRGGCYIQLYVDGEKRGHSFNVFPFQSLAQDLSENAFKAAFKDKDATPITGDEIDKLKIVVCLLTRPVAIAYSDEDNLLEKVIEGKDGVIIRDDSHFACLLPEEWNNTQNKHDFIQKLKKLAGLPEEKGLSNTMQAYKFRAIEIES